MTRFEVNVLLAMALYCASSLSDDWFGSLFFGLWAIWRVLRALFPTAESALMDQTPSPVRRRGEG